MKGRLNMFQIQHAHSLYEDNPMPPLVVATMREALKPEDNNEPHTAKALQLLGNSRSFCIPVCDGKHWRVVLAGPDKGNDKLKLWIYDSSNGKTNATLRNTKRLTAEMTNWAEHLTKKLGKKVAVELMNVGNQSAQDHYNCGVWVLMATKAWMHFQKTCQGGHWPTHFNEAVSKWGTTNRAAADAYRKSIQLPVKERMTAAEGQRQTPVDSQHATETQRPTDDLAFLITQDGQQAISQVNIKEQCTDATLKADRNAIAKGLAHLYPYLCEAQPRDIAKPGDFYNSSTNRRLKQQYRSIPSAGPLDPHTMRTNLPRLNPEQLRAKMTEWEARLVPREEIHRQLSLHPLTRINETETTGQTREEEEEEELQDLHRRPQTKWIDEIDPMAEKMETCRFEKGQTIDKPKEIVAMRTLLIDPTDPHSLVTQYRTQWRHSEGDDSYSHATIDRAGEAVLGILTRANKCALKDEELPTAIVGGTSNRGATDLLMSKKDTKARDAALLTMRTHKKAKQHLRNPHTEHSTLRDLKEGEMKGPTDRDNADAKEWVTWLTAKAKKERSAAHKVVKQHWKRAKQRHNDKTALQDREGNLAVGHMNIANALADHMAHSAPYKMEHRSPPDPNPPPWEDPAHKERLIKAPRPDSTGLDLTISRQGYNKAVHTLNNNKAPGPTRTPNEILKYMPEDFHDALHALMLEMWNSKHVPLTWKKGTFCFHHKKGDVTLQQNYRPIALLEG
eukprot:gene34240-biopygen22004